MDTKLDIDTVLHTKDGRRIGNAIIIGKEGEYNIVKTDYGNECKLTDNEIHELFYIAFSDFTEDEIKFMREQIGEHKNSSKNIT